MLVVVAFAFGLSWVFTTVGLLMRAPNAVMNAGFMALFPLIFVSNGFVEPDTLPGWLEAIVDANPISHVITASRGLMDGDGVGGRHRAGARRGGVLTAIFAPLTTRLYRTRADGDGPRHRHAARPGAGAPAPGRRAAGRAGARVTARAAGWRPATW